MSRKEDYALNEFAPMMARLNAGVLERAFERVKTARGRDRLGNAGLMLLACGIATRSPMHSTGLPGGLQRFRCLYCDAGPGPHGPTCLYRYALALIRGMGCDVQTLQNSAASTLPRT